MRAADSEVHVKRYAMHPLQAAEELPSERLFIVCPQPHRHETTLYGMYGILHLPPPELMHSHQSRKPTNPCGPLDVKGFSGL